MANICHSNSAERALSFEERGDITRLHLAYEVGREILGEGQVSLGPNMAGMLPETVKFHSSWIEEKTKILVPPYETKEQQTLLDFVKQFVCNHYFYIWKEEDVKRYFLHVKPNGEDEFIRLWSVSKKFNSLYREQIEEQTLSGIVCGIQVITVARKKTL